MTCRCSYLVFQVVTNICLVLNYEIHDLRKRYFGVTRLFRENQDIPGLGKPAITGVIDCLCLGLISLESRTVFV